MDNMFKRSPAKGCPRVRLCACALVRLCACALVRLCACARGALACGHPSAPTDRGASAAATEPAAALLVAGTYEKAICGWELGKSGSVVPVFQVVSARVSERSLARRAQRERELLGGVSYPVWVPIQKETQQALAAHAPHSLACQPDAGAWVLPQHQSHLGPVKAVASQGKFLVSGGNDEEVRIYNIQKRFEVGSLMKHQAPITTLRFSRKANSLISGSDDGMIAVWRIKDWECVSFKKAHKGSVTDLDVHPSGKVMLSCGRDNALRLWDLSSAKELYCRAQKVCPDDAAGGDVVHVHAAGDTVAQGSRLDLWQTWDRGCY